MYGRCRYIFLCAGKDCVYYNLVGCVSSLTAFLCFMNYHDNNYNWCANERNNITKSLYFCAVNVIIKNVIIRAG